MRLFIALPVPAKVRALLAQIQADLGSQIANSEIRWQDLERSHLTVLFLGEVEEKALAACRFAVVAAASKVEPFTLSTGKLGVFPGERRPSVIWLGVGGETVSLHQLHTSLSNSLRALGLGSPNQAYRPHLTLGRIKRLDSAGQETLRELLRSELANCISWQVERLQLLRSNLGAGGARYTLLEESRLTQEEE